MKMPQYTTVMKALLLYEAPEVRLLRIHLERNLLVGSPTGESFDNPIGYEGFAMDLTDLFGGLL